MSDKHFGETVGKVTAFPWKNFVPTTKYRINKQAKNKTEG